MSKRREYKREIIVCSMCGGIGKYYTQWIMGTRSKTPQECDQCNGTGLEIKIIYLEPFNPEKADIRIKMFDT